LVDYGKIGLGLGIFLVFTGVALAVSGVDTPGTNPIDFGGNQEPRYDLTAEVKLTSSNEGAEFIDDSFNYETEESGFLGKFIGPSSNLALTGAEDVEVTYKLRRQDGVVVARKTDRNIGNINVFQTKDLTFEAGNLVAGTYDLEIVAEYECASLTTGCDNTDSVTEEVVIPK
jgi:hypothetical protein